MTASRLQTSSVVEARRMASPTRPAIDNAHTHHIAANKITGVSNGKTATDQRHMTKQTLMAGKENHLPTVKDESGIVDRQADRLLLGLSPQNCDKNTDELIANKFDLLAKKTLDEFRRPPLRVFQTIDDILLEPSSFIDHGYGVASIVPGHKDYRECRKNSLHLEESRNGNDKSTTVQQLSLSKVKCDVVHNRIHNGTSNNNITATNNNPPITADQYDKRQDHSQQYQQQQQLQQLQQPQQKQQQQQQQQPQPQLKRQKSLVQQQIDSLTHQAQQHMRPTQEPIQPVTVKRSGSAVLAAANALSQQNQISMQYQPSQHNNINCNNNNKSSRQQSASNKTQPLGVHQVNYIQHHQQQQPQHHAFVIAPPKENIIPVQLRRQRMYQTSTSDDASTPGTTPSPSTSPSFSFRSPTLTTSVNNNNIEDTTTTTTTQTNISQSDDTTKESPVITNTLLSQGNGINNNSYVQHCTSGSKLTSTSLPPIKELPPNKASFEYSDLDSTTDSSDESHSIQYRKYKLMKHYNGGIQRHRGVQRSSTVAAVAYNHNNNHHNNHQHNGNGVANGFEFRSNDETGGSLYKHHMNSSTSVLGNLGRSSDDEMIIIPSHASADEAGGDGLEEVERFSISKTKSFWERLSAKHNNNGKRNNSDNNTTSFVDCNDSQQQSQQQILDRNHRFRQTR